MANQAQLLAFMKRQIDDLERIAKEMQANHEAYMIQQRREWRRRQRESRLSRKINDGTTR